jgi:gamma-glutamyl-gamma-aminobutyrate hydrolase PuuD
MNCRVFVVGGGFQYLQMFHNAGFFGATTIEEADIICFTGGEDVDPAFYGEKPIPGTHFRTKRDEEEANIYGQCLAMKKPMIGICRGAQFLNVMNGGKLWQDVNNHATMKGHPIVVKRTGEVIEGMTSTHHQMMIPADDGEVLALAALSTEKKRDGFSSSRAAPELDDVEVVWYDASSCLCFQPHPEFEVNNCREYFLDLVDSSILPLC